MEPKGAVKIGAAARAAGITVKMARHYEAVGLLPPAIRDEAGSRLFSSVDIHTFRFIGRARSLGFSLQAIRKLLSLWQDAHRSNAETLLLAEEHMTDLLHKQSELTTMIGTLQELIDACAGDGRPECPILDELAVGHQANGFIGHRSTQRASARDVRS
ncbi:MAG: MerR family DNA-binding protein [Hyphomicrobiales bacterium]